MAITIPNSVFDIYNSALDLFTRTATLVYPEKRERCANCYMDTMGTRNRSISVYRPGGPFPFDRGMPCPYCEGKGYRATETTEDIVLRIYWDRKSWADIGPAIDIPDGAIQTIALMTDMDKINKSKYMIPKYDGIEKYDEMRYTKNGSSHPQGFKDNLIKYVVTFWNRIDG